MKVYVDKELCTGCGPCVDICPEVFELDGDIAKTKFEEVPPIYEQACQEAAEQCPTSAIWIET